MEWNWMQRTICDVEGCQSSVTREDPAILSVPEGWQRIRDASGMDALLCPQHALTFRSPEERQALMFGSSR